MKVWIKDSKPVFFPIAGAVPAGDAVEVVNDHNTDTHEAGPVIGVSVANGIVTVRRQVKVKDVKKVKREQLAKDADRADTVPKLQKLAKELIALLP
jgi:hypothetical protein